MISTGHTNVSIIYGTPDSGSGDTLFRVRHTQTRIINHLHTKAKLTHFSLAWNPLNS